MGRAADGLLRATHGERRKHERTGQDSQAARSAASVQRIDGKTAEEFGEEVGGFLRQDLAGKGDFAELIEGERIHKKGGVGLAFGDLIDCLGRIAQIAQVGLLPNGLGGNAEELFKDSAWSCTTSSWR